MTYSLRTLLLLSTALTLVACDDSSSSSDSTYQAELENKIRQTLAANNVYPDQTLSGSFLAGQFAQSHSDWNKATSYFETVRELDPNAPMIDNRIMALAMGAGHYDQAFTVAKKIVKDDTNTDRSLAMMILALESFKNKNYAETLTTLNNAPNDGLGAAVIPLFRAWATAGSGKTDINALLNKTSLSYQAVLIAGFTNNKTVLNDLAAQYDFTKMPISIQNLEAVATVFAQNGQTEAARNIISTLKNGLPSRAELYSKQLKELDSGKLESFTPQLATPQDAFSDALISVAQLLGGNYKDSARIFAQMSAYLQPNDDRPLELLAQIAADSDQTDEAITYLQRINTDIDAEKSVSVKRQIALLLHKSGKEDDAIRILEDVVSQSKNVEAQIQIGDIYRSGEKYDLALSAYNNAFELLDNNIPQKYWDLLFARGMINERLKNWDQAEKDLKAALAYEPDQPYILNYLGYSWADQGKNLDKAAEMIEKAVRLKPTDGAIVDSLGWVYFRMGSYDRAVKTLEQAIELDSTEPEINDHLGDAYWRVGRKNEARFQWKRAISFATDPSMISSITEKLENGLPPLTDKEIADKTSAKMVENKE